MKMQKISGYEIRVTDKQTVEFLKSVFRSKRPVLVHGDIGGGKTTFMKFIATFLIARGEKIFGLTDSNEMEIFEFVEHYRTLWLLPEQLKGCYKEKHPNLHIEYVDLEYWEDLFNIIETSKDDIIICLDFLPLMLYALSQRDFKQYYPSFPEGCLFAVELSTAINAREWRTQENILAGSLIRMIRHGGTNGFHFLGDAQSLEDIDVTFRRTGGFKIVFKRMRLRRTNPIHDYIVRTFPKIAKKILKLPQEEFIALDNDKVYHGVNTIPPFHQDNFDLGKYFIVNKRISFQEKIKRTRIAKKYMLEIINPKKKNSWDDLYGGAY